MKTKTSETQTINPRSDKGIHTSLYRNARKPESHSGTVLIVAMWIVLVLAGLVLVFSRSMRVEAIASANHLSSLQAESIARGGLQFVLSQLSSGETQPMLPGGNNPFEGIELGGGYFWILHPNLTDDRNHSFGISDESSKINLNSATQEMLLKLPGMTAELAASIIDWRDEDSNVTAGGAESEYYLLLPEPYYCKNSPFETTEEVLLVKGASPEILYGEDTNRNGVLEANENDAEQNAPADNKNGRLDRGLYDYVTVYSKTANKTGDGEDRININNMQQQSKLAKLLQENLTDSSKYFQMMSTVRSAMLFDNIFDFYFSAGLTTDEFKQMADKLTTVNSEEIVGLVNVNTAPFEVLACLPGLEESDAEAIVSYRSTAEAEELESIAWIADALPKEKAIAVGSHITVRSSQHCADIVSISGDGRSYQRYKAVVATQNNTSLVLYWKSLTHLGWPLDPEIVASLRGGNSLGQAGLTTNMGSSL